MLVDLTGDQHAVIHTHASAVIVGSDHVYKLKKPVDMGFLDYSTPERRRAFCMEEVRINRALAPTVYLGVAPVLRLPNGAARFGPILTPAEAPEIGAICDGHVVIDYAVVMRRLEEERTLAALVRRGEATPELIEHIARTVATFHSSQLHDRSARSCPESAGNWLLW